MVGQREPGAEEKKRSLINRQKTSFEPSLPRRTTALAGPEGNFMERSPLDPHGCVPDLPESVKVPEKVGWEDLSGGLVLAMLANNAYGTPVILGNCGE